MLRSCNYQLPEPSRPNVGQCQNIYAITHRLDIGKLEALIQRQLLHQARQALR